MAAKKDEKGFTLVELAIVLMIIGLLIGGILRGQELMNNARVSGTIKQVQSYTGAVTTFQDAYIGLPGDMPNANLRLPGCTATPCSIVGNGNSRIGNTYVSPFVQYGGAIANGPTDENRTFWAHLAAAHMISGVKAVYSGTPNSFGEDFPDTPFGGGMQVAYYNITDPDWPGIPSGHFIVSVSDFGLAPGATNTGIMPIRFLDQMDRKMDDGMPRSGNLFGANCGWTQVANSYNVNANANSQCNFIFRLL